MGYLIFLAAVFKIIWIHESENNLLYFEINNFCLIAPWFWKTYSIEILTNCNKAPVEPYKE